MSPRTSRSRASRAVRVRGDVRGTSMGAPGRGLRLVTYMADAAPGVAGRLAGSGTIVVLLAATLLRARFNRTPIAIPREAGWVVLYVAAYTFTTVVAADRAAATKPFFDLVGYAALVILLIALMDTEQWVRRFAWAVASALGSMALLAVYQQLSRSYDADFGGLARVEIDGGLTRSGGPISANYFGQVLAAGGVLAAYLALAARSGRERAVALRHPRCGCGRPRLHVLSRSHRRTDRGGIAGSNTPACAAGRSRPRGVGDRVRRDVPAAPRSRGSRRQLDELASPTPGRIRRCVAVRARTWPRSRCGAPIRSEAWVRRTSSCDYLDYSARIGIDDRAEDRSAHSLYLESLAETGLIGGIPLFGLIFVALRRPWQARRRLAARRGTCRRGRFRRARRVPRERGDPAQRVPSLHVGVFRARARGGPAGLLRSTMIAAVVFWAAGVVVWMYAGYPVLLGSRRPTSTAAARTDSRRVPISVDRRRAQRGLDHREQGRESASSTYPRALLEVVVASDGSDDRTVERARNAGAHLVIDLPRVGKLRALNEAVDRTSGEILVFSDADSVLPPETLHELVSNFADPQVGAVAANEVHVANGPNGVARGESLYWRYEQKLKALEDRVGSTVSASGRLFAMRRCLRTVDEHRGGRRCRSLDRGHPGRPPARVR